VHEGPARVRIALALSVPSLVPPGSEQSFDVTILPGDDTIIPGSTMGMYRADDDDEFVSLPLTLVTGDTYRAVLPAPRCGQTPQFYFTAAGVDSGVVTYPFGAPENVLTFDVGVDE